MTMSMSHRCDVLVVTLGTAATDTVVGSKDVTRQPSPREPSATEPRLRRAVKAVEEKFRGHPSPEKDLNMKILRYNRRLLQLKMPDVTPSKYEPLRT